MTIPAASIFALARKGILVLMRKVFFLQANQCSRAAYHILITLQARAQTGFNLFRLYIESIFFSLARFL